MRINYLANIGIVVLAFLVILGLHLSIKPEGDWTPLFYVVPVMAIMLHFLIKANR